jgi:lipid-binding SYLF domain-containing protein
VRTRIAEESGRQAQKKYASNAPLSRKKGRRMKNTMHSQKFTSIVLLLIFAVLSGCSATRSSGINTALNDIASMERIANNHNLYGLYPYEGVALLSLGKAGAIGFGIIGWSASVFVKDPAKNEFGPPSFVDAGGFSIGLAYGVVTSADCLLLFNHREDAVNFAKKSANINFTNEANFLIWGRKQMTISGANSYSDGAGLSLGAVELEFLFGGPRDSMHENMYETGATVDKILAGDVAIPEELKPGLERLNRLMTR